MKRISAFIIAFIICFSGCSKEQSSPVIGTVKDGVYRSETFGITFSGEDWSYLSEDEIAELMGVTVDELFSEEFAAALDEVSVLYDMNATSPDGEVNLSINHENTGLVASDIDVESYLGLSAENIETALAASGAFVEECLIDFVEIKSGEVACLNLTLDISGTVVYEKLVAKQTDGWISVATFSSGSEDAILDSLTLLEFD